MHKCIIVHTYIDWAFVDALAVVFPQKLSMGIVRIQNAYNTNVFAVCVCGIKLPELTELQLKHFGSIFEKPLCEMMMTIMMMMLYTLDVEYSKSTLTKISIIGKILLFFLHQQTAVLVWIWCLSACLCIVWKKKQSGKYAVKTKTPTYRRRWSQETNETNNVQPQHIASTSTNDSTSFIFGMLLICSFCNSLFG